MDKKFAGLGTLALAISLIGCTPQQPASGTDQASAAETNQPVVDHPAAMTNEPVEQPAADQAMGEVKEFTLEMGNFFFKPSEVKVKQGDKVKLVFKNMDGFHDFMIDELAISSRKLKTGEETSVEFVAAKPGTYEFYCSVGQHRANGMKGMLIIE